MQIVYCFNYVHATRPLNINHALHVLTSALFNNETTSMWLSLPECISMIVNDKKDLECLTA